MEHKGLKTNTKNVNFSSFDLIHIIVMTLMEWLVLFATYLGGAMFQSWPKNCLSWMEICWNIATRKGGYIPSNLDNVMKIAIYINYFINLLAI